MGVKYLTLAVDRPYHVLYVEIRFVDCDLLVKVAVSNLPKLMSRSRKVTSPLLPSVLIIPHFKVKLQPIYEIIRISPRFIPARNTYFRTVFIQIIMF